MISGKHLSYFRILGVAVLAMVSCTGRPSYATLGGFAQGGRYSVSVNTAGLNMSVDRLQESVDSILLEIDGTLSGYNKSSLVSRFNAGEPVEPNALFERMYRLAYDLAVSSGGVVNCGAAPLFDIWGFGFNDGSFPDAGMVKEAMGRCTMKAYEELRFDGSDCVTLNFNAIAQGFSCDLVAEFLDAAGATDYLVDIGEIYCKGHNPKGRNWTIGIDAPYDGNNTPGDILQAVHTCGTEGLGIVTSGNYRKFYIRDGRKYSHTIDPRTGYPVDHNLLSATVEAHTAAQADAAATFCMVVGLEEARKFICDSGLEGFLVYSAPTGVETWHSEGFCLITH